MTNIYVPPQGLLVVNNLFLGLATLTTGLRLYVRQIKQQSLRCEDYLILAAYVVYVGLAASYDIDIIEGGLGKHLVDVSPQSQLLVGKLAVVVTILLRAIRLLVKVSILLFYKSIFSIPGFRKVVNVVLVGVVFSGVALFFAGILICIPVSKQWDPFQPGTCGDQLADWIADAIINLIFDVVIVILPMRMLWGLQIRLAKKIGLTLVFGVGIFICAITILVIFALESLNYADFTYTATNTTLWQAMESALLVIGPSLPFMPGVFSEDSRKFITSMFSRRSGSKRSILSSFKAREQRSAGGSNNKFGRLYDDHVPLSKLDHSHERSGNMTTVSHHTVKSIPDRPSLDADTAQITVTHSFQVSAV